MRRRSASASCTASLRLCVSARTLCSDPPMSDYRIHGATGEWEVVIGLEVHAQVTSRAKLFSGASTDFGAEPNSQVSLVDAAMPGMLPTPNRECIRQAGGTGTGVGAEGDGGGRGG